MGWFDKKTDADYEEFLENPKERYDKFMAKAKELMEENKTLKDSLDAKEQDYTQLEEEYSEEVNRITRDHAIETGDLKRQITSEQFKADTAERQYRTATSNEKERLVNYYDMEIAKKSAKLEENYNHEVHTFIESQNERNQELIPAIIKETIQAFHAKAS